MLNLVGFFVAVALAVANGANDQLKGVASLIGSGSTSFDSARRWASITTVVGALASMLVGAKLAASFSGGGLVPAGNLHEPGFLIAVGLGATLTVAIAARVGLPVSTTHALLGGLLGAGAISARGQLAYVVLTSRFLVPLLVSPLVAFVLAAFAHAGFRCVRLHLRVEPGTCICANVSEPVTMIGYDSIGMFARPSSGALPVIERCAAPGRSHIASATASQVTRVAHFISAGVVGAARGLNDTPKIAAVMASAGSAALAPGAFGIVALGMLAGGWWGARRVATTMGERITTLDEGRALTASVVTAVLVLVASLLALPVSMTHVAVGSMVGAGSTAGDAQRAALRQVALAWLATLPLAALLAALLFILQTRWIR